MKDENYSKLIVNIILIILGLLALKLLISFVMIAKGFSSIILLLVVVLFVL